MKFKDMFLTETAYAPRHPWEPEKSYDHPKDTLAGAKYHSKMSDKHYELAQKHEKLATLNGSSKDLHHIRLADKHTAAMRAHSKASDMYKGFSANKAHLDGRKADELSDSIKE